MPLPVPYPAACRPQAWSAAAAVAVLSAVLGLRPDVPGGSLGVRPAAPSPVGGVAVEGLRLGAQALDVTVDAAGHLVLTRTKAAVHVEP